MMRFLNHLIDDTDVNEPISEMDVRVAACALMLEMVHVDHEFSNEESDALIKILSQEYGLSADDAKTLTREAARKREESLDLWHFTNRINKTFTKEEKIRVVELLWKIIYADGRLTGHEDYLIHKLSDMLNLSHPQLIEAKIHVLHGGD